MCPHGLVCGNDPDKNGGVAGREHQPSSSVSSRRRVSLRYQHEGDHHEGDDGSDECPDGPESCLRIVPSSCHRIFGTGHQIRRAISYRFFGQSPTALEHWMRRSYKLYSGSD